MRVISYLQNSESAVDYLLNVFILVLGVFAYIETLSWTRSAALWPRYTSIVIIVTATILLFRKYVPESFEAIVSDESIVGSGDSEEPSPEIIDDEEEASEAEDIDNLGRFSIDNSVFTVASMFVYIGAGFLIGLLWATPLFIAIYCWWFHKKWYITVLLAVIGFVVAYTFMTLLYLPIDGGVLVERVFQ